jgi:hypothetical protein
MYVTIGQTYCVKPPHPLPGQLTFGKAVDPGFCSR